MISHKALLTFGFLTAGLHSTQGATTWIANADLVANETPNSPSELLNPNFTVPEWS